MHKDSKFHRDRPNLLGDFGKKKVTVAEPILDSAKVDVPENLEEILDAAAESSGAASLRGSAMTIALAFVEEGDFTFEAIDSLIQGYADLDGDGDVSEDEQMVYEELVSDVCDALVKMGGSKEEIAGFFESEDDSKGAALGEKLKDAMNDEVMDDATIIAQFSVSDDVLVDPITDASKERKIVNGKAKWVKKKLKRRKPLSSARRQALKKARRKAHTGAAKMKRKKSKRLSASMGLS